MTKPSEPGPQMSFPGVRVLHAAGAAIEVRNRRLPQQEILAALERAVGPRGLVEIYRTEVLPIKTRRLQLLGRKCYAAILHTLLGYEVKAEVKRIQCPDLVTARYVKLFSELGCRSVHLPYDPTVTARLIPEMEQSLERIRASVREMFPQDRELQLYVTRYQFALIRAGLRRNT